MLDLHELKRFFKNKKWPLVTYLVISSMIVIACVMSLMSIMKFADTEETIRENLTWWQKDIVYQIYPRSFQDSDGDGTGDLKGIVSRLQYLKDLGIGAIWMSPFYKSPMKDFGYDVSDYTQVDPLFGTMQDFDELVTQAHKLGLKVIVDYVPNHTSDQHRWFQLSRNRTEKFKDFFIWTHGIKLENGTRVPPNNWISVFGGSTWHWDDIRQQYYYHAFLKEQPDLNYRNPQVIKEMANVIRFWLDRGVDGFRIDAIPYLFEVKNISKNVKPGDKDQHGYRFMMNQPEIFGVIRRWKQVLDEYEKRDGKARWLVAETADIPEKERHKYYDAGATPFFFGLILETEKCEEVNANCIRNIVKMGTALRAGEWPNFVTGNHDNWRVSDRYGPDFVDAMNMLLLTLPGTPTTYYGEEIGLTNGNYLGLVPRDPFANISGNWSNSRDPERNPFQWNTSKNAGFSTTASDKLWLPITPNTNYKYVNVEIESENMNSTLSIYKTLAALRKRRAFQNAGITFPTADDNVLHYTRSNGFETYCILINFGRITKTFVMDIKYKYGYVEAVTGGVFLQLHETIKMRRITLNRGDGLVIKLLQT